MDCGLLRVSKVSPLKVRLVGTAGVRASSSDRQANVTFCSSSASSSWRRSLVVKAATAESNKYEFKSAGTPLEPHSHAGKFLSSILQNQPHILVVAATELLEEMAFDRDASMVRQERSLGSSEACLHRRIAEMKEVENQIAVEEVIYMLVVRQFSKIRVPMVPRLSEFSSSGRVEIWPCKDKELESVYSPEILELVKEHIHNILGWKRRYGRMMKWSSAQISRLQLGQLYAASIMYGYFLMTASLKHRLECRIARTDVNNDNHPLGCAICVTQVSSQLSSFEEDVDVLDNKSINGVLSSLSPGYSQLRRSKDLRTYVTSFDPKAVQLCSKLRSQAVVNIIENHSLAVFGDGDKNNLESSDMVSVTFSGLKRLMLEAVAFGTFLWDAEELVDSIYRLQGNHAEICR